MMNSNPQVISALLVTGWLVMAPAALAQSPTEEAASLQEQLAAQQARNEELRRRIAALEEVLQTDVCKNPEAVKLLREPASIN